MPKSVRGMSIGEENERSINPVRSDISRFSKGAVGHDTGKNVTVSVPFCRVIGTVKPTRESDIRFEVWLPPGADWNGKFEGVPPPPNLRLTELIDQLDVIREEKRTSRDLWRKMERVPPDRPDPKKRSAG